MAPKMWQSRLLTGQFKIMESDVPICGTETDAEMRDDGSILCTKRYLFLRRK